MRESTAAEFTLEFTAFMDASLQGKTALVTGGARRVGAAIARRLHAAGANVVLHYRDSEADAAKLEAELNAARAKSATRVKAELLAPIAPRALVSAALDSFGRLDLLVNNASSFFPVAIGAIEASHWEELIGSNLKAPLFISQEAAPHLAKQQGAIVNIVDIHAERPLKGYPLYSIAKAGPRRADALARRRARAGGARQRRRAGRHRLARGRPVPRRRARAHRRHHAARPASARPKTSRRRYTSSPARPSSPARSWRSTAGARSTLGTHGVDLAHRRGAARNRLGGGTQVHRRLHAPAALRDHRSRR